MTTVKRISMLVLLGASLAAAGCGSDDDEGAPIPAEQAQALLQQLDTVQARLDNGSVGACQDVFTHPESPNQPAVDGILTQIPQDVDPEVRSALEQSFQRLWDLVAQECDERQPDEPAETQPEPTPTETTETTPPEETETDPDEAPLPPDGDGDDGGEDPPGKGKDKDKDNGNGIGNGGGVGPGSSQ